MPLLLAGGAGALGHWRLSAGGQPPAAARPLFEAYRAYALEAAVKEHRLVQAVSLLREVGIEALLGKGFAAARHYARPGLRPYGDIDLFLAPGLRVRARSVLRASGHALPVDLHAGYAELDDRTEGELWARAVRLTVQGVEVCTFGAEDHLRLIALHLLRHGGGRPLWLCDVAALIEAEGPALDWDRVLAGPEHRARAVASVIGAASRLLGARVPAHPALERSGWNRPPRWLEPALLGQWGHGSGFRRPLAEEAGEPRRWLAALRGRWPNALEATAGLGAPFDDAPRWPYAIAFAAVRALRFARARGRFDD